MPSIRNHGGGCCGVRHFVGFGNPWVNGERAFTQADIQEYLNRYYSGDNGGRTKGKCVEAVVTDRQFKAHPELSQLLADAGFKLKTRFSNSSGGMCNVLHRTTGGRDLALAARRATFLRPLLETA